ncbi:MAG: ABC transporter ATP-binding protein [Planctomycetota bacterium]|nr:ABC transporter ATP-binding protein [Planctomycetota bacterium]
MIEVQNLVKDYGPRRAVDGINLSIPAGKIVGFLGPNGAGKTTTLRMLTGYLPPTSGRASIAGHDVITDSAAARAKIGYQPENTPLYPEMRVEEYLHYRGKLFGMDRASRRSRIDLVVDRCGLTLVRRRLIGYLSKGNRQRVGLAQALLHDPPVLILDEPTAGLDPNQIIEVRKLLADLRGKHTVLLSTHILKEIELVADSLVVIARGRVEAEGTPEELRRKVASAGRVVLEAKADKNAMEQAIRKIDGVAGVEASMNAGWCRAIVTPKDGRDLRDALGQAMFSAGWPLRELSYEMASLEQFFVQITARQNQAPGA